MLNFVLSWVYIHVKGRHYGSFITKEEAAIEYNRLAQICYGEFARLNKIKPKLIRRVL